MILVWNDAKSFKRHVETMKMFRLSHCAYPADGLLLRDMPEPHEIAPAPRERLITCLTDSRGKVILVPIWEMAMPPGSRN